MQFVEAVIRNPPPQLYDGFTCTLDEKDNRRKICEGTLENSQRHHKKTRATVVTRPDFGYVPEATFTLPADAVKNPKDPSTYTDYLYQIYAKTYDDCKTVVPPPNKYISEADKFNVTIVCSWSLYFVLSPKKIDNNNETTIQVSCRDITNDNEYHQCNDGVDNDSDGLIDDNDIGCQKHGSSEMD
jgi:hypothetical protein